MRQEERRLVDAALLIGYIKGRIEAAEHCLASGSLERAKEHLERARTVIRNIPVPDVVEEELCSEEAQPLPAAVVEAPWVQGGGR
jgi:hypothetical protein